MLSGDSEHTLRGNGGTLSASTILRGRRRKPSWRQYEPTSLMASNVLMLGDGINDVPVLAGADVSAAVVEASDLVKSKADVLLLSSRLAPSGRTGEPGPSAARRITRQNLIWAAAYNLTAIPIAAFGFMPPWLAALGMAASSTLVMLNATRLLSFGERGERWKPDGNTGGADTCLHCADRDCGSDISLGSQ